MNRFPEGKSFALSILDDTDLCSMEKVQPVYHLLAELGMFTTKSVWPLAAPPGDYCGATLEEKRYADFVLDLQAQGFEIGLHNVRHSGAARELTEIGIERFHDVLGHYPRVQSNHNNNEENVYWGTQRFAQPAVRLAYRLGTCSRIVSLGHVKESPYFWGDLCRQHISYVRNLVFDELNLDRINPSMPYHEASKPYVNYWFSSCLGGDVDTFCHMLSGANQDGLEAEGGVAIVYTHFAYGFSRDGALDPRFERLMRRLASKKGWFVPVSVLLDHLMRIRSADGIDPTELATMEHRWLLSRLKHGAS